MQEFFHGVTPFMELEGLLEDVEIVLYSRILKMAGIGKLAFTSGALDPVRRIAWKG